MKIIKQGASREEMEEARKRRWEAEYERDYDAAHAENERRNEMYRAVRQHKCEVCGCVFWFQRQDVYLWNDRDNWLYVHCPNCGQGREININKPK